MSSPDSMVIPSMGSGQESSADDSFRFDFLSSSKPQREKSRHSLVLPKGSRPYKLRISPIVTRKAASDVGDYFAKGPHSPGGGNGFYSHVPPKSSGVPVHSAGGTLVLPRVDPMTAKSSSPPRAQPQDQGLKRLLTPDHSSRTGRQSVAPSVASAASEMKASIRSRLRDSRNGPRTSESTRATARVVRQAHARSRPVSEVGTVISSSSYQRAMGRFPPSPLSSLPSPNKMMTVSQKLEGLRDEFENLLNFVDLMEKHQRQAKRINEAFSRFYCLLHKNPRFRDALINSAGKTPLSAVIELTDNELVRGDNSSKRIKLFSKLKKLLVDYKAALLVGASKATPKLRKIIITTAKTMGIKVGKSGCCCF